MYTRIDESRQKAKTAGTENHRSVVTSVLARHECKRKPTKFVDPSSEVRWRELRKTVSQQAERLSASRLRPRHASRTELSRGVPKAVKRRTLCMQAMSSDRCKRMTFILSNVSLDFYVFQVDPYRPDFCNSLVNSFTI